jgi:hypothetical protein
MADEIAQHPVDGPQPAEGAEYQPDDVLCLLVRIQDGSLEGRQT